MPWWVWMLLASLALAAVFGAGWVAAGTRWGRAAHARRLGAPAEVDQSWADNEAALFGTERS